MLYAAIAEYKTNGRVIEGLGDFMSPPQSLWRLFWKSFLLPVLILLACAIPGGILFTIAGESTIVMAILGIIVLVLACWIAPKFVVILPYLSMNTDAGLRDAFRFSNGFYWYLTKVILWVFLITFGVELVGAIFRVTGAFMPGTISQIVLGVVEICLAIVSFIVWTFAAFVYVWACDAIMQSRGENKA